jgi:membrane protease YdiL (CAAX protease family)
MPFYVANITQAILFALLHMNLIQIIYAFPLGLIFGYVTKKYRSLIPAILLHALINGFSVLSVAYNKITEEPIDLSIWFMLVLTIVGGFIFVAGYFKINRNTYIEEKAVQEIQV